MKKTVFTLLLSVLFIPLFASYNLSGKVVDSQTSQPIDFANIALYKQGSETPWAGVVTDENGVFEITAIESGKYTMRISFVGYNAYSRNFTVSDKDLNFSIIRLTEDSNVLTEVEVVGQGSQMRFEIDRKVFSVDQNIASAGGSATEVLENIPSVEVDQEGNISLRNNESVEVWINGKPSGLTAENRAQILQQMPAESIESIEVITNPSAKFNPEGTAGIINLVLKKDRKAGYYGSVSVGAIYPDGGRLGGNVGANINYSSSKIDAYANIGYRNMTRNGGSVSNLWNFNANDTTLLNQNNNNSSLHNGLFFRAGVDYHINDKNTIGLSGFGMNGGGSSNALLNYTQKNVTTDAILREYNRRNTEDSERNSFNINLDYKHEFNKKGTELLASLSYSRFSRTNESNYLQTDVFPVERESEISQNSDGNDSNLQFKVDYTNKISETGRFEAGWQSNVSNRYSYTDGFDVTKGTDLSGYYNVFDYKEQIHAAYVTYGERFFKKLSVQLGLRGEYMYRNIDSKDYIGSEMPDYQKSYFELFPSAYLGYSITDRDEVQLNYTRRVNRPRGWQINPFKDYSDSTNVSFGNVALSPEFSSAFELNYLKSWDNHSFSASAYYRFTDDVVQRISYRTEENMESTFMNISQSKSAGLELVAKNRLFRILNLTSSVNLYYSKIDSATYINPYNNITESIREQEGFSWNARVMANFMFSPTFTGQVSANYSSPRVIAQGTQEANYAIDLGLRKSFFNRNLNVSLNVRDLLDSRRRKSQTSGAGFEKYSESYWHGRSFGVTLTYNFGNMQPNRNAKRNNNQSTESDMDMDMDI
ncbi:TonB-dependent receptor [Paludibacter sp. 221]|uniref:outer membrane beta-barrel family protein n=1 Tax=Paludibacter sp. 221 TaxID=2302939 RepID=UPI0013D3A2D6|nr:outer membrane beta-barrel family protein [Paludibacter sp. 221]NDV47069.1 TonB-dependent receptor [Paludibacter sp. 221]